MKDLIMAKEMIEILGRFEDAEFIGVSHNAVLVGALVELIKLISHKVQSEEKVFMDLRLFVGESASRFSVMLVGPEFLGPKVREYFDTFKFLSGFDFEVIL